MQASGLDKELTDAGVRVEWANISGGPQSIQAFRADKLDCSAVADIPSLFAAWTGTSTRIIFQSVTLDPLKYPTYELGVAPGVPVASLADLRGKKIAYSAGQAQGALVLRVLQKAGLTRKDVTLVELASTGDSYVTALGSKAVDVAPLGAANVKIYQAKYPGAGSIPTGIRDDAATLYCIAVSGIRGIPASWDNADIRLQQTADLLAEQQGHEKLDVSTLVDRRFEKVEAAAAGSHLVTGAAA